MKKINWLYHWHWNILRAKYGDWSLIHFFFLIEKEAFHSFLEWHTHVLAKMLQLCLTLCNPMDCSLPGSSVHGILLQAGILEWVACPPPGDLLHSGIELVSLMSPALASGSLTISTTWEAIYMWVCLCVYIFSFKAAFGSRVLFLVLKKGSEVNEIRMQRKSWD